MGTKGEQKPTEAELEILQVLWANGPNTVRFVHDQLNRKKKVGYTTTLKIMQIMAERGLLDRDERNRSHVYRPLVEEGETTGLLLNRFMDAAFGGSALKLVMQALGNKRASKAELREIRAYLDKLDGKQ